MICRPTEPHRAFGIGILDCEISPYAAEIPLLKPLGNCRRRNSAAPGPFLAHQPASMATPQVQRLQRELEEERALRTKAEASARTRLVVAVALGILTAGATAFGSYAAYVKAPAEKYKAQAEALVTLKDALARSLDEEGRHEDAHRVRVEGIDSIQKLLEKVRRLEMRIPPDLVSPPKVNSARTSALSGSTVEESKPPPATGADQSPAKPPTETAHVQEDRPNPILFGTVEIAFSADGATSTASLPLKGSTASEAASSFSEAVNASLELQRLTNPGRQSDRIDRQGRTPDISWVHDSLEIAYFTAPNLTSQEKQDIVAELQRLSPPTLEVPR